MLKMMVTAMALLAIGATAPADEPTAGLTPSAAGASLQVRTAGVGSEPSHDGFEGLLMMILAAGGIGVQLRRKYQASARMWRRIGIDDVVALDVGATRRERPAPAPAMTWQQTPT